MDARRPDQHKGRIVISGRASLYEANDTWYSRLTRRGQLTPWYVKIASLLALGAAWQSYGSRGDVFAIAPVSKVAVSLWEGIVGGELLTAALGTFHVMLLGYAIAVLLGVTVGVALAVSSWARNTLEPLVNAAYATPMALMIPVIGIYTGLGFRGRVTLTVFWCVFEIIVNTSNGVRSVPTSYIDVARSFNASRRILYANIILPAALPPIAVGLRLAVGRALRGAVTAEVLLSVSNLGRVMVSASNRFDVPDLLAGIVFVMLLGFVMMRLGELVERRMVRLRHGIA